MQIKNVRLITEEERNIDGIVFLNGTDDQFPYVESALNSLDNNFNWWKENWPNIEQLISKYLLEAAGKNTAISISSRFTVFHGAEDTAKDIIWTGPAIVYTLEGAKPDTVKTIKDSFGGMHKGRKVFVDDNQLIFLFG